MKSFASTRAELESDRELLTKPRTWEQNEVEFSLPTIWAGNELNYSKNNWKTSKKVLAWKCFIRWVKQLYGRSFVHSHAFWELVNIFPVLCFAAALDAHILTAMVRASMNANAIFWSTNFFGSFKADYVYKQPRGNGCHQQTNGMFQ